MNNFKVQPLTDHNGVEQRVRDCYERNKILIDLSAQPEPIKVLVDTCIHENVRTTITPQVGLHFMKFCGKYDLAKISAQADTYARWLNSPYNGTLQAAKSE